MSYTVATSLLVAVLGMTYVFYKRSSSGRISITDLPGPEPESYLIGNLQTFLQSQAGEIDLKWQELYGDVIHFKGPLGESRLLISDPKAIHHIFIASGYKYPKEEGRRKLNLHLLGNGLSAAEGPIHKRQRKIMEPAFRQNETKALLPVVQKNIHNLTDKWKDMLQVAPNKTATVQVCWWLGKLTLDIIGEAAFDYHFHALDEKETTLRAVFENFAMQAYGSLTYWDIVRSNVAPRLPRPVIWFLSKCKPDPRAIRVKKTFEVAAKVAQELIDAKSEALAEGRETKKDMMSLLVRANCSENEKHRMSNEEMVSQMRTIMLAGHETTATAIAWALRELAQHADVQNRLRKEVMTKSREIQARGGSGFTTSDYDDMAYLNAVVKETLRFNPPAYSAFRQAGSDDVLPLSKPVVTRSGKIISEVPIPKDAKIMISVNGYNRHRDVFGPDSHIFDPDRWLTPGRIESTAPVGVFANMLTFAGGIRSCIGWRLAVLEMQVLIAELMLNFEIGMTPEAHNVRREASMVMAPTIEGQVNKGAQLPLSIKLLSAEEW